MNCPNCNNPMQNESFYYYSLGGWDMDYPDEYHEEYWCPYCRIRFVNDEWEIPSSIIATDKQINAGRIIENNTGIKMPPPIKKLMSKYIGDNMELSQKRYEEYKKQRAQLFEEWCEENSDWLPEYY